MRKKQGRCNNYDECDKARGDPIEADEFNFICPSCGKALKPLIKPPGYNWPLLGALALIVIVTFGGIAYLFGLFEDWSEPPPPVEDRLKSSPPVRQIECSPQPHLMEGKNTLYKRVLTLSNATLFSKPGGSDGLQLDSMQQFYVYDQRQVEGKEWLQVGNTANCQTEGWLSADRAVPWKQQITVAFDNPAGRERVLLFRDVADLKNIAKSEKYAQKLEILQDDVRNQRYNESIISAEPENYVPFSEHPYLLPIIDVKEVTHNKGFPLQLLKIHTISKNNATAAPLTPEKHPRAAVVFVIDSTISMKQYIDNTKQAVKELFDQLSQSPGGSEIDFGLVVFRSSTKAVPGLEYITRILVRPEVENNRNVFLNAIENVEEAGESSKKFDEDAYAGINEALEILKKSSKSYDSRHIILITDAGPLGSTDELSSSNKSAQDLFESAKDQPIVRLYAIHLKTQQGLKVGNHSRAEQEYRELTHNVQTGDSLYYPVEDAGSLTNFNYQIKCLSGFIANISAHITDPDQIISLCPSVSNNPQLNETLQKMRNHAVILGQALGLEYLGMQSEGKGIPDDFGGWISDRDLISPIRPSVEVRVLLTKRELNNLANGVEAILNAAKTGKTSPDQFFRILQNFVTGMGRDSARTKPKKNISISEIGVLGEYLDDLPYKSQVMTLDENTWSLYNETDVDQLILTLESKLERYATYEADNALWWPKTPDTEEDEKIYPIPLDALP